MNALADQHGRSLSNGVASILHDRRPVREQGDRLVLVTFLVFMLFEVLQGPLRYYLSLMGGVVLAYAPKGLMLLTFFVLIMRKLWTLRMNRAVLAGGAILGAFMIVGFFTTQRISQPLMGVFSLLPTLFGFTAAHAFARFSTRILPWALALWLCVAIGVAFNNFHSMPWTGFTYQLGDAEVEASRDWSYFGVERVAGFARASFEAATQLLFLGLACVILLRRKSLAVAVWIATGCLISVTTTKTTLGLFLFLSVLLPVVTSRRVPRRCKQVVGTGLPFALVLVGVLLPIGSLFTRSVAGLASKDPSTLFVSFGVRLAEMWPNTFSMIFQHGNAVFGRGIGGIGAAQKMFEPDIYSPGDNVYLYLYGTFGLFALALIWKFTRAVSRLAFSKGPTTILVWLLGVSIMMEGWTVSCIEGGSMGLIIGIVAAFSTRWDAAVRDDYSPGVVEHPALKGMAS